MRWPFRRRSSGRHLLGAAVTAIPGGPLPTQTVRPVAPADAPAPVQVVTPVQVSPPPLPAPPPPPFVPGQAGTVDPIPMDDLLLLAPHVQAVPVPQPARPQAEPAAERPDPALPPEPPQPAPPAVAGAGEPARAGTRVELGFADGSYRMLDPASDTARALSELVAELTAASPDPATTDK